MVRSRDKRPEKIKVKLCGSSIFANGLKYGSVDSNTLTNGETNTWRARQRIKQREVFQEENLTLFLVAKLLSFFSNSLSFLYSSEVLKRLAHFGISRCERRIKFNSSFISY